MKATKDLSKTTQTAGGKTGFTELLWNVQSPLPAARHAHPQTHEGAEEER